MDDRHANLLTAYQDLIRELEGVLEQIDRELASARYAVDKFHARFRYHVPLNREIQIHAPDDIRRMIQKVRREHESTVNPGAEP